MADIFPAGSVLQIGQRMEFFLDNMTEGVASRIEDIQGKKLVVAMPVDSTNRLVIPMSNEHIYGSAISKGCRYRFFTTFRDKAMDTIPVWIIDMPETVERYQNREFVRVPVTMPLKVRVMDEDGALGPLTETTTVDISGGGIAFTWLKRVKVGTSVSVEINNLPGIGTLSLMCMVARCMAKETEDATTYLIGVRMLNLTRPIRNKLVKFIFDIQRQNLAKGIRINN